MDYVPAVVLHAGICRLPQATLTSYLRSYQGGVGSVYQMPITQVRFLSSSLMSVLKNLPL